MSKRRGQTGVDHPVTPDGRYFIVRGQLWRRANPDLPADQKDMLIHALMDARRAIAAANRSGDESGRASARAEVDRLKQALGERGPVWWHDGAPDFNRRMARNTPYADWFASQMSDSSELPD